MSIKPIEDMFEEMRAEEMQAMKNEIASLTAERDRFKARAEAAERDIRMALRGFPGDVCEICSKHRRGRCSTCKDAEWRGSMEV